MKASDYLKFYRAFVSLYGAITSDEAYKIIKNYYPKTNKIEFLKDLKSRSRKRTVDYAVYQFAGPNFLIVHDLMTFEQINKMLESHIDKPFYVPESVDDFLKYSDPGYIEENDAFNILYDYLKKLYKDDKKAYLDATVIAYQIKVDMRIEASVDLIQETYQFKDEKDIEDFIKIYSIVNNNTKKQSNSGHSPNELKIIASAKK